MLDDKTKIERGILTPLVTPMLEADVLDVEGLRRGVEHVIAGGVRGVFLLGTTGEGPSLSGRMRLEVLERVAGFVAGRVAMLVNVTGTSFADNIDLARAAADAGATVAVYSGPLYSPVTQAQLLWHVERFAAKCPLPVFLYNMPSHTNVRFDVDTVVKLAESGSIAGLKDSSADLMYLQKLSHALGPDFPLFVGPEELLYPAMIAAGVAGGVNGGSNLFPHLYVGLHDAIRAGNHVEAARLHALVLKVSRLVYGNGYLPGLKAALKAAGICTTTVMMEPGVPHPAEVAAQIAEAVALPEFQPS